MAGDAWRADAGSIQAIVSGTHDDPFAVLGLHKHGSTWVMRAFQPAAESLEAESLKGRALGALERRHDAGFFEGAISVRKSQPVRLKAANAGGAWDFIDAYTLGPVLGPLDDYLSAEGSHLRLFDKLGAHAMQHEGIEGVHFALWAPNARRVSVVGSFNDWDGRRHVMRRRNGAGIWEIFIPGATPGATYKYELIGPDGGLLPLKSDPFGFQAQLRPKSDSVVADPAPLEWNDAAYLQARADMDFRRAPVSIYEVHLGSWRRTEGDRFLTYRELAETLVPYARDMGFTHLELMPVSEHPFDPSWGYQPTGLFAPTARFGTPEDFAAFMDAAHAAGLGVILDWVPAHFPTDDHGLAHFDGTALYEHEDPRRGFHPDWNTAIYNFGRREVANFLVNNALFWLERYHADGLRVDAVASMLYLDYSREEGAWLPNIHGGRENLEAIDFLQTLNRVVYGQHPGIMTCAEESTAWPGVSTPVHEGGLGFGFKWNMGFMNDTLRYMEREAIHRTHHHDELTFGLVYAFTENFILPLSHDEVVHGKGSMLDKMPGDDWQKFANLRAYYAFMWGYPGKKLLFMGGEFAQRAEWNHAQSLDWHLLDHGLHQGMQKLVRDLNHLYRDTPALHARDCEGEGFEWLVVDDAQNSVFGWLRKSGGDDPMAVVISNFTPVPRHDYRIPLPQGGRWIECINSDASEYGGSGMGNFGAIRADDHPYAHMPCSAGITLPPLSTLIFVHEARKTDD